MTTVRHEGGVGSGLIQLRRAVGHYSMWFRSRDFQFSADTSAGKTLSHMGLGFQKTKFASPERCAVYDLGSSCNSRRHDFSTILRPWQAFSCWQL
ncbi:MAG: hypothetical protein DWI00_04740 [Planctomycetota bacterium]|nr:MAG: hypothetical protein DWI00_04740 [Planctomycetota bacterium]